MDGLLKLTALCNAGILIEYDGGSILVDGIGANFGGFTGLSPVLYQKILNREGPFAQLRGVFFTHCHPDHFDEPRVRMLRTMRPECRFFIPNEKTLPFGCIQCGPFSVMYYETLHMPQNFEQVRHFVLLIIAGTSSMYFASDAVLDAELHQSLLRDAPPSYIFVNPVYLAVQETRELLSDLRPKRIFVYHIPFDMSEQNGIRRKAQRTITRYGAQLPPVTLIDTYPMKLL